MRRGLAAVAALALLAGAGRAADAVRIATFNLRDVRPDAVADQDNGRLRTLAGIIQSVRPDVLLLTEIAYDFPAGWPADGSDGSGGGTVAARFAETFLATPQAEDLEGLRYTVFVAPPNTGVHSGHDLDNDGRVNPRAKGREYGNDSLGYGEFPGQFAMALLVREGFSVREEEVRTFRNFLWRDMPGADLPPDPADASKGWYSAEELAVLPLSSKSHWDLPIRTPAGGVVHVLCSHPTPPVFDGPEDRNGRRNHDEIRFWKDYLSGESYIVDDRGVRGGLPADAHFVIAGDLNADPEGGNSRNNPIMLLLGHPRVNGDLAPASVIALEGKDLTDTADFRLRVDYAQPSRSLRVLDSGVWRGLADNPGPVGGARPQRAEPAELLPKFPSDHYPVWVDVEIPGPGR